MSGIKKGMITGVLAGMILVISGCTSKTPISRTDFKLDTVVTITLYDSKDISLIDHCMELCDEYEKIFSRTDRDSELYKLNHRELSPVKGTEDSYELSSELADLIREGVAFSKETDGAFDIAIAPLTRLWDFKSEEHVIPKDREIKRAVSKCGCEEVFFEGSRIILPSQDTEFDLGSIAKGYIADRLKEYLEGEGVRSATIDLGGNVVCIGDKKGAPFKIGIQKPFADRNETISIMDIKDKSVVSSGIYERFFVKNDVLYHHLLNPKTGYPYKNGLLSVTIVSDRSVDGDALSTACFALGLKKGLAFAETQKGVQAVFITENGDVHYTKNFHKEISVQEQKSK